MGRNMNRRRFVQASAAAAGYWLTGGVTQTHAGEGGNTANNRLNIAIIGAGGRGGSNLGGVSGENIVALCDVDDRAAAQAYNRFPNATRYKDFRRMLERERNIDAVVVSTPDHLHAHAAIAAMRMGKHCYCEKPLTHSVWEARQMKEVARANRVATQMGNQGTSDSGLRTAVEVIRAGAIGDVREVHVWTNRPIWPQGIDRPQERPPVPAELDWDLWLGPAPERPYHSAYVPFRWRGWWDFGTGALGDMGCHTMNLPYMALRLGAPTAVSAEVEGPVNNETAPGRGCTVTYEFPARENMPACRMYWYERRRPPMELFQGVMPSNSGCLLIGARGTLYSGSDYGSSYRLLPAENFRDFTPPQPTLPRSPGHHQEWLRACKGGTAAMSNFVDYASALTETVLLGNVAIRAGRRIVWDSERLQVMDNPAAQAFIRREYRQGWNL